MRVQGRFGHELLSIALFGSAITNEWVKDRSDVDLIVIVGNKIKRREVEEYVDQVLLDLDGKYEMGFRETCPACRKSSKLQSRPCDLCTLTVS